MHPTCRFAFVVALVALRANADAGAAMSARYVVVELDRAGVVRPLWQKRVWLEGGRDQGAPAATVGGGCDEPAITATVVDSAGIVRFAEVVQPVLWLRGEFAGAGGIDGHLLPLDRGLAVIRAPLIAGGRLVLRAGDAPPVVVPEELPGPPLVAASAATAIVGVVQHTGSPANRLDVLIVGEGYRSTELAKFMADGNTLATAFLAVTPYAEYASFLNITLLYTPSQESGADHPPYRGDCLQIDPTCCADPAAASDPRAGAFPDTAFDARFCTQGIHRLLTVNSARVLAAAAAVPDWDIVLVLVNDPVYGGSGGQFAVVSAHANVAEIAQHELGHSFAGLADEYETPFPGYPRCSDAGPVPGCEPNVTDVVVRDAIKWSPWVLPSTPLPTSASDPSFAGVVGLFEGARYRATGMFRPRVRCLMRQLGAPFCEVCRQEYPRRLYEGGWGSPTAGIALIDPGSESPPPGAVGVREGQVVHFYAGFVRPANDPSLEVSWFADGVPIENADEGHLAWPAPAPGTHRIELVVRDVAGFIHPAVAVPEDRRSWDVTVWAARPPRARLGR